MDQKEYGRLIARLTRIEERTVSLFKICSRTEIQINKDTEEINKNKNDLTIIKTWGAMALIVVPLIVSIIMERI
jgi:hypothetical protein|tara:strand:+ start:503 stop:724 length:222 start_codon:yes stop_codon:yes gene_type:complete